MGRRLRSFAINRRKWLRGKGHGSLYDTITGKSCCLGFYMAAVNNAKRRCFANTGVPSAVGIGYIVPGWLAANEREIDLAEINDNVHTKRKNREAAIKAAFAKRGVRVSFHG